MDGPSQHGIPGSRMRVRRRWLRTGLAVALVVVVGVLALASRLPARLQSGRLGLMVPTLILSLVTCALAARTVARNGDYASLEAITRSTTEVSPHNFRARVLWLDALLGGHQDERVAREAHRLIADTERVMDSELPVYTISSCVPGYYRPAAYSRLGKALLRLDRTEEALTAYLMSLRYRPNNEGAHYGAGVALLAAVAEWRRSSATRLHPGTREHLRPRPVSPASDRSSGYGTC